MNLRRLTTIISLLLASLLVYASCMWAYMRSKTGFDFFPFIGDYQKVLFWGFVIAQLVIATLLAFHKTRLKGMYGCFFLLASLSAYLYVMLHYADHIPCNCTGIIPGLSWQGHMWFTIGFTILAGTGIAILPDKDIHAHE